MDHVASKQASNNARSGWRHRHHPIPWLLQGGVNRVSKARWCCCCCRYVRVWKTTADGELISQVWTNCHSCKKGVACMLSSDCCCPGSWSWCCCRCCCSCCRQSRFSWLDILRATKNVCELLILMIGNGHQTGISKSKIAWNSCSYIIELSCSRYLCFWSQESFFGNFIFNLNYRNSDLFFSYILEDLK